MNALSKLMVVMTLLSSLLLAACQTRPADVAERAAQIADFSLPEGYQPELALELSGYSLVSYRPGDEHSHFYLVQAPADQDVSQEKLEELLNQAGIGKKDNHTRLTVVEKSAVTIRGQETTLVISEGTNGDGEAYRQATTAFAGKTGPAMLVLSEPTDRWDDARVDQLIGSIQ